MELNNLTFRTALIPSDVDLFISFAQGTELFTEEEVGIVRELAEDNLEKREKSDYQFLIAGQNNDITGFTCYGRIPLTDERYDLYWILVDPLYQKQGIGTVLLTKTEEIIRLLGGQHIYIETSSKDSYTHTRQFYERNCYKKIAILSDYYRLDDSKVMYRKTLGIVQKSTTFI